MAARISACLVLYHSGDEALKAVDCLDASDAEIDVYLVDNTPQDETANRILWQHPGVTVLPQETNLGFGKGNNAVLPLLKSEYHLLVNPDVTFDKTLISRMVAYMDATPSCVILTPRVFNTDGTEQFLPKKQPTIRYLASGFFERFGGIFTRWRREFTLADEHIRMPVKVQFATGCFLLIRTEAFRQLKGFDERFFLYQQDSDLSRRAMNVGNIVYHPDMTVTHEWHRDNTRSLRGIRRQMTSILKFFLKWGFRW